MNTRFIRLSAMAVIAAAVYASPACTEKTEIEKTRLDTPEVSVESKTDSSFTIRWEAVENAVTYSVDFMGEKTETDLTEQLFTGLESGATYEVAVKANPSDPEKFVESAWCTVSVTLDTAGTDEPGPEPQPEKNFEIVMDFDETAMMLFCSITPADMDMYYYRETMTQAQVDEVGGGSVADAWQNAWDGYVDMFGSSVWDYYVSQGTDQWSAGTSYGETEYVMAAGIDEDLNRITEVEYEFIETGDAPMSDNTFEIWAEDITASSAKVYVKPSNSDPFSLILVESEDIDGYTDEELEELISTVYWDYIYDGNIFTQEMYMDYKEGTLYPDTEHTALVFGWNSMLTTEINKYTFRTEAATSGDNLTWEITAEPVDGYTIHVVFVPSDPNAQYLALAVPDYDFEGYEDYPPQYIIDVCENSWIPITIAEYAEMFAHTGTWDGEFNYDWDGIMPETTYVIWAVGFTADGDGGTFGNWQIHPETVTTPAD